ncbi:MULTISPECIES: MFS transporter [Bacillus]|uniref:MFS transporter n=1 Tax=Bacillus TaxID=1386 RepID=UPI000617181E|nr:MULTISPECIES: MFS transporter [Bacillus]MBU8786482.1 MFS transporter [Bacillus glycinifermentans]MDU0069813.1 MFS transporter [Bacillus sp. IG6]MED8018099.1 MFS transporter [Bacillus glycinifermentans]WKB79332.1 MFS transporter [Bacillus glycinifermentans]SCA85925.1 transporter [Bacillus glycinifermentans]
MNWVKKLSRKKGVKSIIALSSVPLVMTLGNSMLIPVLPVIEKKLGITSFQVSLIITVYSIVAILCIPITGYLSDRFGRKKVMLPCLIIAGAGGAVAGAASSWFNEPYALILAGRVLQGIGSAGAAPIVMPFIGDLFQDDEEVSAGLGDIETANTAGKVLSPILGAFLASWVWFMPFWFIPVVSLISFFLVLFLVPKPKEKVAETKSLKEFAKNVKTIFKREGRWLVSIFIIGGIIMFLLFGVLFYLSENLEKAYKIDGIVKGALLSIPLLFLSVSSYLAGKLIGNNKIRMKICVMVGMILLVLSFGGMWWNHSFYPLFLFMSIGGIGIGMALPSLDALITEGIDKEERGTISSFYNSMRFIGVALGPPVFAYMMTNAARLIFIVSLLCSLAALTLVLFYIDPKENENEAAKTV